MQNITTVIAEDHQLYVEGLKNILKKSPNYTFEILAEATDGNSLFSILQRVKPDLLLLDLNMPKVDGLEVLKKLNGQRKEMKIMALTMYDEAKLVKSAFKSGVDGYVLKNSKPDELLNAIEIILEGKTYLGVGVELNSLKKELNGSLVEKFDHSRFDDRFSQKYNLTKRELQILKLITEAMSNKEIGKELFISDQTVGVHRKNIMKKLNVSNIAGLIKIAYDNQLV